MLKRFKLDPFSLENNFTVFDFTFFIDRLCDEIIAEKKEDEQTKDNKLLKMLRYMKNVLNEYDI